MPPLVECVPNFSEGRDRRIIEAIAAAISATSHVRLLDVDSGTDTNRTVYTFVGPPDAVGDAAFNAASCAVDLIDMTRHRGAHPRLGAMDVCPFVPVSDVTMADCVTLAHAVGRRIGDQLDVPVFFYEYAATSESRRALSAIRQGEYEGLAARLTGPDWTPDAGPRAFRPRAGAFVVGARQFLLAYNVNLNTTDRRLAHDIALSIRETGRIQRDVDGQPVRDGNGEPVRIPGRLKGVRAIGWYIDAYRQAQVSVNVTDFHTTPLHEVFEAVCDEASKRGLVVTGSELVGLTPIEPLLAAGRHFLGRQGKPRAAAERDLVSMATTSLGLAQLTPFDPQAKIIEYRIREPRPLVALSVDRFVDEVASESPAPGGGSTAALLGAVGAALAAMVAQLAVGKSDTALEASTRVGERAHRVKARLVDAIDEDATAFRAVMEAIRMPRGSVEHDAARALALDAAAERATLVPLESARLCADVAETALEAVRLGHRPSASDAGVAALAARAGAEAAALNVAINLPAIRDTAHRAHLQAEADLAVRRAREAATATLEQVAALLPSLTSQPA